MKRRNGDDDDDDDDDDDYDDQDAANWDSNDFGASTVVK
jgi:hypothetical protein